MPQLQDVFSRIQKSRKDGREIRAAYREALSNSQVYQETVEKLEALKMKKKQLEQGIKDEFRNELTKLDLLKLDIKTDMEVLSDLAFNQLLKGERLEVTDEYENKYEPIFSVRFKKIG